MTSRERLLTVLRGEIPDCVPVAPDFSNMIPAKLTGKPFWDVYLYNDPPLFEAYMDCAKLFNIDSLMDGFVPLALPGEEPEGGGPEWERFLVERREDRLVVQASYLSRGERVWDEVVTVYPRDKTPAGIEPRRIGLPPVPERWEPLEGVKPVRTDEAHFNEMRDRLGDQGLMGAWVASTCALGSPEGVYNYYDHPERHEQWAQERVEAAEARFARILRMAQPPDFLAVGGSGTLIFQTVEIFRQLALPAVKRAIELATAAGIPTQIHSCGPERELVRIMAEETTLTVIDPLEIPPMGDCELADLKRHWGDRIVLKGNLHTTEVMLRGTPEQVAAASRQAIDDAAEGGRFILATGDQCGRDTPFENLRVMVDTAREYGRY